MLGGLGQRLRSRADRWRGSALAGRAGVSVGKRVGIGPSVRIRVAAGGALRLGDGAYIDEGTVLQVGPGALLTIGPNCFVGHHCTLAAEDRIVLSDGAFLAEMVSVRDHDHIVGRPPRTSGLVTTPIEIGKDVWVGAKASVLRGTRIGHGSVVGAHALVRSDVPPRHLVAGVPATIRRPLGAEPNSL